MGWLFLLFIFLIFIVIVSALKPKETVVSNWQHSFDSIQFSSQEFYEAVQRAIERRQIPAVSFSRVNHVERHILSARREYLRIARNEYTFDVCAAPFGTGSFVSWWLVQKQNFRQTLLEKNFAQSLMKLQPKLAELGDLKTYFQVDTEAMFKGAVHAAVMEAIEEVTTNKGFRGLSELERKPVDLARK